MKSLDIKDTEALKVFLHGLVVACPLNGDPNPQHCQLHDIRLLSLEERFDWVDALSDEKAAAYYTAHLKCYSETAARNGLV